MELFPHQKKIIAILKDYADKGIQLTYNVEVKSKPVFGSQVPFPIALKKAMITMPQPEVVSGCTNDRIVDATFLIQRSEPLPTDQLFVIAKPRSNIEAAELKVFVDFTAPFFLGETDEKS